MKRIDSPKKTPDDIQCWDRWFKLQEIKKIADTMMIQKRKEDSFWCMSVKNLFVAVSLYALDSSQGENITPNEVIRFVRQENFAQWVKEILHEKEALDPLCIEKFEKFLSMESRLQCTVIESFLSFFDEKSRGYYACH